MPKGAKIQPSTQQGNNMTDINDNDAVHESHLDAELYIGCEQHLVDAEVSPLAAGHAQDTINSASCDIHSNSGDTIMATLYDSDELSQMFFDWLNVGTPLCDKQRAFIHALEIQLAKDYDA